MTRLPTEPSSVGAALAGKEADTSPRSQYTLQLFPGSFISDNVSLSTKGQSLQEKHQWKPGKRANQPPSVTVSWLLTSRPKKTDHFSTIYGLQPSSCAPVCMFSLI